MKTIPLIAIFLWISLSLAGCGAGSSVGDFRVTGLDVSYTEPDDSMVIQ